MNPKDRKHQLTSLFERALDLHGREREEFLASLQEQDPMLACELDSLLRHDAKDTHPALKSPLSEASVADHIGPYQLVRKLGEGGMGSVFLAHQTSPVERIVALKLVKPGMDTREVIMRFESERRVLAWMDHPNIARVFDAGTTDHGLPYFVMEYVAGSAIDRYCNARKLDLDTRLELFLSVCRGVRHAHQKGIIHRDLKPTNVMVSEVDGKPLIKVIDFGIAKAIEPTEHDQTLTHVGGIVGTPDYMSPEQTDPERPLDTRVDIYSLGVMLYELLTGRRPIDFRSLPRELAFLKLRGEEPKKPSACILDEKHESHAADLSTGVTQLSRRLRGDLDRIVLKALEKDPEQRYQSIAEFEDDLERFLRNEPVRATPKTTTYLLRKYLRKHYGRVSAVALVFLSLVIGLSIALWQNQRAQKSAAEANAHLANYRRMADIRLFHDLMKEARETLWPPIPQRMADFGVWLKRADELIARLPQHERRLQELTHLQSFAPLAQDSQWERSVLEELVTGVQRMMEPHPWMGRHAVEDRLEKARVLETLSQENAMDWEEAISVISDPELCPLYQGLVIEEQVDLAPLGFVESSGLFEFWHVNTGERPTFDPDKGGVIDSPSQGIVLVLLPGGTSKMGSSIAPSFGPHCDPHAKLDEAPVHEVPLDPFFISKFEITQAQWKRWVGTDVSRYSPRTTGSAPFSFTSLHPAEQISFVDCELVLRQMGLCLPTEAQWEYACRSNTDTAWSFGNDETKMLEFANFADSTASILFRESFRIVKSAVDRYAVHAPVGSYTPNAFGLHDMHGNVAEWCQDWIDVYTRPFEPGTGLRIVEGIGNANRVVRGGSYAELPWRCRSAYRFSATIETRSPEIGVRPARALVR